MLNEREPGRRDSSNWFPNWKGWIRTANQMIGLINQSLVMPKLAAGLTDLRALQRDLSALASNLVAGAEALIRKSYALKNDVLSGASCPDRQLRKGDEGPGAGLARSPDDELCGGSPAGPRVNWPRSNRQEPVKERGARGRRIGPSRSGEEGSILVVDDMDDNRQLLLRRTGAAWLFRCN